MQRGLVGNIVQRFEQRGYQLKALKLESILEAYATGHTWILCRKNDREGLVECHALDAIPELVRTEQPACFVTPRA